MRHLSSLLCLIVVSACGPMSQQCRTDADCDPDSFCMNTMCVLREEPDAGQPSTDAGAVADAGAADAGNPADAGLDAGVVDSGVPDAGPPPECDVGDVRACCGDRGEQRCESVDGGSSWSACDAPLEAESCNGIDDDCDGTIDDELAWDDGDGGVTSELACSIGVGACASDGFYVCDSSGMPTCGATVIDAGVEICDGIDNDCDGTTDEGTKVTCVSDADNDRYAAPGTSAVEVCPDVMRAAFGNCPVGYVAPSSSLGTDCDDASASTFRNAQVRVDADGDAYCVGGVVQRCVGATLPSGVRDPSTCQATDDCSDSASERFRMASTRTDADNDGYCVGSAASTCIGATAPSGSKLSTACQSSDDCNDTSATIFQNAVVAVDADNDAYCAGAGSVRCIGSAPPIGYRYPGNCVATSDCDDANGQTFQIARIRTDADGDERCVGAALSACIGVTPPAGVRLETSCRVGADDCNDSSAGAFRVVNMYPDADNDQHCAATAVPQCVGGVAALPGFRALEACVDVADCADGDSSKWRNVNLRQDYDGDGYCRAATQMVCIGTNPQTGWRSPANCQATVDCDDDNFDARATCQFTLSLTRIKACGPGISATQDIDYPWDCGPGFHATSRVGPTFVGGANISTEFFWGGLSYTRDGTNTVRATCNPLAVGEKLLNVDVTCTAD